MDPSGGAASDLVVAARARNLSVAAQIVEQPAVRASLAEMAPVDEALDPKRSKQLVPLLGLLARRGIDPDALAWFMPHFESAPVLRSIVAWDVLTGAVLVADAGVDVFRELASDIAGLLGSGGRRGCSPAVARDLVPRLSDSSTSTSDLLERAISSDLGALVELAARGSDLALRARAQLGEARQRAKLFARAHLATLATFQLAVLWLVFDDRDALLELIDVLLDVGNVDPISAIATLDADDMSYVEYRVALARNDAPAAMAAARQLRDKRTLRATAVLVDVASRTRRRNEEAEKALAAMLVADPDCHFAARVAAIARLLGGADPTSTLDTFLGRFGNDVDLLVDLAAAADRVPGLAPAVQRVVARELFFLPHEPAVWRGLALMIPEPFATALRNEVDARLVSQSTFP